ncbi:MAG: addiction module protein [Verrucomicrobia bacterium]|nr:addiction module protein [Verrucomicrobiota bacterium]
MSKTGVIEKLRTRLNLAQVEIDKLWAVEAERRVAQIEAGTVEVVPDDVVFGKIPKKLVQ